MKLFPFSLALTKRNPGPGTAVPRRLSSVPDDYATSPMFTSFELTGRLTSLSNEAFELLNQA